MACLCHIKVERGEVLGSVNTFSVHISIWTKSQCINNHVRQEITMTDSSALAVDGRNSLETFFPLWTSEADSFPT